MKNLKGNEYTLIKEALVLYWNLRDTWADQTNKKKWKRLEILKDKAFHKVLRRRRSKQK